MAVQNGATLPPQGVVTLLFTDVEGSTAQWEQFAHRFGEALQLHERLIREAIARHHGYEVKTVGDSFMVAFQRPADAVRCAADIQATFAMAEAQFPVWREVGGIRVRIGIHTGEPTFRDNDYFGPPVIRAARIADAGHGGMTLLSQETVRLAADKLGDEYQLDDRGLHRLKDLGQPERLFVLGHPSIPKRPFAPLRTLEALRHNFPALMTSFVGRARELEELTDLLRLRRSRLITLTGPGGTGKTRLAMQVAAERLQDFPDGVWFVELAGVQEAEGVSTAIALALKPDDLHPQADPRRQITEMLRPRRCLLVLDNFEQVADAAPLVSDLLRECPMLTCLVTSRVLLHLSGELEYPLEPLTIPPPGKTDNHWAQYESVQLFVERCQSFKPDFQLTDDIAPVIGEICRQLDGIPLAIELAAARVRGMTPQQVLQRLSRRFDLLASSQRDLPERQRTLRSAIDWSYDLLSEEERALFAELAVFAGGFFLEAAEEVCQTPNVFDLIFSLRDKSLLKTDEIDGQIRYFMLETLRAYALERLGQTGWLHDLRQRHAQCYLRLAEELSTRLDGAGSGDAAPARQQMTADIDNMRAGMDWAVQQNDHATVSAYGQALARFFLARGLYAEGDQRLSMAEGACRQQGDQKALAMILLQRGRVAWKQAKHEEAQALISESYEISKQSGDRARMVPALNNMAMIAWGQGDYRRARAQWEEALEIAREVRHPRYEATLLSNLGAVAAEQGDFDAADRHFADALAIQKRINDEGGIAYTLMNSHDVLRRRGQFAAARQRLEESRRHFTALGNRQGIALASVHMGLTYIWEGGYEEAESHLDEGLRIAQEIGDRRCEMYALVGKGRIAGARGDLQAALSLYRCSFVIAGEIGDRKHISEVLRHVGHTLSESGQAELAYRALAYAYQEFNALNLIDRVEVAGLLDQLRGLLGPTVAAQLDEAACGAPERLLSGT